jgi:hypothetical protein
MKNILVVTVLALLAGGCGVELLTTTAIEGKLQADNLKAMKGQVNRVADSTAKVNLQRAIDTYYAEKGHYPSSLAELAPAYMPSIPTRPDGAPYSYDSATGKLLDGPGPVTTGPTQGDVQKMNQIWVAIDQYGRATGYYPPSLAALVPTYLPALPKTDSGQDFIFNPQTAQLLHPAQAAAPAQPVQPARPAGVGGAGPMGEVMTGIGIQNQLNSMGSSATNGAGSYARQNVNGVTNQHNRQQERVMNDLGL